MDRWTSLVLAAREDQEDQEAADALFEAAYDQVWRCCAGLVDPGRADQLTDQTFARAIEGPEGPEGHASGRTWLLSLARRTCAEEFRSRRRQRRREAVRRVLRRRRPRGLRLVGTGPIPVTELLSHLDVDRRAALVLIQLVGLSYEEVADVCRWPVTTVRAEVARARVELLRHVGHPDRGGGAGRADRGAPGR